MALSPGALAPQEGRHGTSNIRNCDNRNVGARKVYQPGHLEARRWEEGEEMKAKIIIPDGWYQLRTGQTVKRGDMCLEEEGRKMNWYRLPEDDVQVNRDEIIIRKIKVKVKK